MTSPDFTPYIDLTPLDVDPAAIYTGAIELARLTIPEFTLRQGTPEDAIFQAMSFVSALTVGAINRLPPRLMVGLANILGYTKFAGTRATVDTTITLVDYEAATIPSGTIFAWDYEDATGDTFQYAFELVDNLDIAAGTPPTLPSGTATLRSLTPGLLPNLPAGTELIIVTTDTSIDTAVTTSTFVNGEDPENDTEYMDSVTTYLRSLSSNVSTGAQAQAAILSNFRDVGRCKVYDLTNPAGALAIGDPAEPGYATAFVYGRGRQMTVSERATIQTYLEGRINASIIQDVLPYNLCGIGVRLSLVYDDSYEQVAISGAVSTAIESFLSPDQYPAFDDTVRSTAILAQVMKVDGVLYVDEVILQPINGYSSKQWLDVRVATTASITIATALNAGDTIDGITLANGDRVLVKNQSGSPAENGIYVVGASPARSSDANEAGEFALNKVIYVTEGTQAGYYKLNTSGPYTIGTTGLSFVAATGFENITFELKGSLPDVSLGSVTVELTGQTV